MKRILLHVLSIGLMASAVGCSSKQALFNGKDLTGWRVVPADQQSIWSVKEGVIHCLGKPNGYIRTEKQYADYHLHVEWRWVENPTNSGVLLHGHGLDKVWPDCIEAQLMNQHAGDFILIGPQASVVVDGKKYDNSKNQYTGIPQKISGVENPAGQWNSYDIFCRKDTIQLLVNGFEQNKAVNVQPAKGFICLQSEGSPIEFKNIYLVELK